MNCLLDLNRRLQGTAFYQRLCLSFLVTLFLLLSFTPPAHAQLRMKAYAGLDGYYQVGDWMPVTVDVSNTGRTVEGRLQISLPRSDPRYFVRYFKPVELGGSAQQRHILYVRPESFLGDMKVQLDGRAVDREVNLPTGRLRILQGVDALLMVLGSEQNGLSFLTGVPVHPAPPKSKPPSSSSGGPSGEIRVAYASRPEDVPDDRRGLNAARLLILGDMSLETLPPERLQAVKDWLLWGGTLVVMGGTDYRRLQTPSLAELLPVEVSGVRSAPGARVFKTRLSGAASVTAARLKPGASAVPDSDGLVSQKTYGLGRVMFIAFDATAPNSVSDPKTLWQGVIDAASPKLSAPSSPLPAPSYRGTGGSSLSNIAMQMPGVGSPSFGLLAGYLLLYLFLLSPVNFWLLRRIKRQELAWITVPAIILVFTLGSYGAGYAMKGSSIRLNAITLIRAGSGAGRAAATTQLALFSPSRHSYRAELDQSQASLVPTEPDNPYGGYNPSGNFSYSCAQGEHPGLEDMNLNMWTVRGFKMDHFVDLGGSVDGAFSLSPPRERIEKATKDKKMTRVATGRVTNNTSRRLEKCALRSGVFASGFFDLNPGETKSGPIFLDQSSPALPITSDDDKRAPAFNRIMAESQMFNRLQLIALTASPPLGVKFDGRTPSGSSACILTVRLDETAAGDAAP